VHGLIPECVWERRYGQINACEELLTSANTIIIKLFLHISREEQLRRFREREQNAMKAWKLSADDWRERKRWDEYDKAYGDALQACSTEYAPWYVVPADHKWFRDLAVSDVLARALLPHRDGWRAILEEMNRERRAVIEAQSVDRELDQQRPTG
jgi:polyphosphate kinase 2 (PPK2 family)